MRFMLLHASLWLLLFAGCGCSSSYGEAHCPAGIADIHPRLVAGALLVIPVKINQSGPYDFMVDTGSQLNVIDPGLAAQLKLKSQGTVGLIETATSSQASLAVLDSLEAGSQKVDRPLVAIQDLGPIQSADPHIRGVLGENFLAHFDVLLDYSHLLLCLDQEKLLEGGLRGERIQLQRPKQTVDEMPYSERLVISVSLADTGNRPILLQIDSGSDGPIIYAGNNELDQLLLKRAKLQGRDVGDAHRAFAILPPQDMKVGSRVFRKVPFVTPVFAVQNLPHREESGILATILFQRVYLSHSDHFVIFDPK